MGTWILASSEERRNWWPPRGSSSAVGARSLPIRCLSSSALTTWPSVGSDPRSTNLSVSDCLNCCMQTRSSRWTCEHGAGDARNLVLEMRHEVYAEQAEKAAFKSVEVAAKIEPSSTTKVTS